MTDAAPLDARADRMVRAGAIAWIVTTIQFIIGMIVTQIGYGPPTYSITGNFISDLGAVYCQRWGGAGAFEGGYVCSPWHLVFNISIFILGLLLITGVALISPAFRRGRAHWVGLGILAIAGIGGIGVGLFPEDVNITAHALSAVIAFAGVGIALLALGAVMFLEPWWKNFAVYTVISAIVGLIALGLFLVKAYGPLGVGGMERLIVAPVLLWALVIGIQVLRWPRPTPVVSSASASA